MLRYDVAGLFFLVLVLSLATAQDGGENDNVTCQKCNCTSSDDAQTLTINCADRNFHHVGGEWPQHNSTLIVSLAGGYMPTLEPLPYTDAVVEIVLSRCKITYLEADLFIDTKNIKFIDLSYNRISAEQISSEKFRGPYNDTAYEPIALEHLDLAYNEIHSLGKNVFEHLPNLKVLKLEGNDFKLLDIHTQLAISSIRMLQRLNLADNELTEMIGGAIKAHENLTELDLSKNKLDFVPSSLAEIGKSLEVLILDDNPIMEFTSETFLGLGNVVELSANGLSKLKYVNPNTFASMPKLKKLSLSNNFLLNDIDREAFGINQTIKEFYLNNNDLYRLDYHLLPWSQLDVFEIKENPFDCSCDLYNITVDLSRDITEQEDGPYCEDPRTGRFMPVYSLKKDICELKNRNVAKIQSIEHHFSMLRTATIILVTIIAIGAVLALVLGLLKYRKYRRGLNYRYATQISYNPVAMNPRV